MDESKHHVLKKYSRPAGDCSQLMNLEAMVGEKRRSDELEFAQSRASRAERLLPYGAAHVA